MAEIKKNPPMSNISEFCILFTQRRLELFGDMVHL